MCKMSGGSLEGAEQHRPAARHRVCDGSGRFAGPCEPAAELWLEDGRRCDPEMASRRFYASVAGGHSHGCGGTAPRRRSLAQGRLAITMPLAVLVVKLNAVQVLALSCLGVVLGVALKKLFPLLDRLNIRRRWRADSSTLRSLSRCVSGT